MPGVLGDGRAAGLGDPLALARRPGRRRRVLTAADLLDPRARSTQANYGNVFLLLIGGPIVGFMVESLQRMAAERDRAQRDAAAAAERARLARAVHDGVLQVLALVQRRGAELGGEAPSWAGWPASRRPRCAP